MKKTKYIFGAIFLFLIVIGFSTSFFLSQQNQDIRQQASSGIGYLCSDTRPCDQGLVCIHRHCEEVAVVPHCNPHCLDNYECVEGNKCVSKGGERCTKGSCGEGLVCNTSPYGNFCVKDEDSSPDAEIPDYDKEGDAPKSSTGYVNASDCKLKCVDDIHTYCGGPNNRYCIPYTDFQLCINEGNTPIECNGESQEPDEDELKDCKIESDCPINQTCNKSSGKCVVVDTSTPTPTPKVTPIPSPTPNNDEGKLGDQCSLAHQCRTGLACATSPFGSFCVPENEAGDAELVDPEDEDEDKIPANSIGYVSASDCRLKCESGNCSGPNNRYCISKAQTDYDKCIAQGTLPDHCQHYLDVDVDKPKDCKVGSDCPINQRCNKDIGKCVVVEVAEDSMDDFELDFSSGLAGNGAIPITQEMLESEDGVQEYLNMVGNSALASAVVGGTVLTGGWIAELTGGMISEVGLGQLTSSGLEGFYSYGSNFIAEPVIGAVGSVTESLISVLPTAIQPYALPGAQAIGLTIGASQVSKICEQDPTSLECAMGVVGFQMMLEGPGVNPKTTYENDVNYVISDSGGEKIILDNIPLGEGDEGIVYLGNIDDDKNVAVKIIGESVGASQNMQRLSEMEEALINAGREDLFPHITRTHGKVSGEIGEGFAMDYMPNEFDPLQGFSSQDEEVLRDLFTTLDSEGFLHGDMGLENFRRNSEGGIVVIDPVGTLPTGDLVSVHIIDTSIPFDFESPYATYEGGKTFSLKVSGVGAPKTNIEALESLINCYYGGPLPSGYAFQLEQEILEDSIFWDLD